VFALGVSERTTPFAIERIARNAARISESEISIFAVDLPKSRATIHLDMVFTMIDRDAALVYEPAILGAQRGAVYRIDAGKSGKLKFREVDSLLGGLAEKGIELSPVLCAKGHPIHQQREQWLSGANSFAFAPGQILVYSCNKLTMEALSDAGFAIIGAEDFLNRRKSPSEYGRLAITFDGIELARGGGGARCMTLPVERASLG
jgi:arginine deiminase